MVIVRAGRIIRRLEQDMTLLERHSLAREGRAGRERRPVDLFPVHTIQGCYLS